MWSLVLLFVIGAVSNGATASPQCVDESGNAVDWYIVYKFPYLSHLHQPLFGGYRYAVITSAVSDGWHLSSHNITEASSIFARTLAPVYGSDVSHLHSVFYNDQPPGPDSVPSTFAHSKGVVVGDDKQGFWLIHTVPHFAPEKGSYSYVASGGRYGQVAMCISLDAANLAKVVGDNFLTSHPWVYHSHAASSASALGQAVTHLAARKWSTNNAYVATNLTSLGGVHFTSFYKSPNDHVDLYGGIVASRMHSSLQVETWRKNPGNPLESNCTHSDTKVENVHDLKLSFVNSAETGHFTYTDDHSKWAISDKASGANIVCLGDINRMESQFKRGGGTTCLTSPSVWKAFQSFISSVEKCNN